MVLIRRTVADCSVSESRPPYPCLGCDLACPFFVRPRHQRAKALTEKPNKIRGLTRRVKAVAEDWGEGAEGDALPCQVLGTCTDTKKREINQAKKF